MAILRSLWTWIISLFPAKTVSTTPSSSIGIGITSDIGAVAGTVTEATKLASQIQGELNTQPEIDAKVRQEKQDRLDAINEAIRKGDIETLRKLSSP